MKAITLSIILCISILSATIAQIPNSSFESWYSANTKINYWVNTNGLMDVPGGGNSQTVFKTTDAHSGSFACKMVSAKVNNKPAGIFVPDYAASIFVGEQFLTTSTRGFAYTYRPANFEFWYKYLPVGLDSANSVVVLTKWNVAASKRDTIATGFFFTASNDTSKYLKGIMPLTYFNTLTPDTAIILFSALTLSSKNAGSAFTIDDVAFTGGNVGSQENAFEKQVTLFPNPVTNKLTIQFREVKPITNIEIYNALGQKVKTDVATNTSIAELDFTMLNEGIYFINIESSENKLMKRIEVIK